MKADVEGYDWAGLPQGVRAAVSLPALVMAGSFLGFGGRG